MYKLTFIANGRRFVRQLTASQVLAIADELEQLRPTLEQFAITVLFEGDDGVTHIVARRDRIAA